MQGFHFQGCSVLITRLASLSKAALPRQAQSQVRNSTRERWRVISPLSTLSTAADFFHASFRGTMQSAHGSEGHATMKLDFSWAGSLMTNKSPRLLILYFCFLTIF
jgi:hypothetical protein